jgi:hypothetical protein
LTTDQGPDNRSSIHQRLTVARRGVHQIVEPLEGTILGPEALATAAADLAAERSPYRTAARARLDATAARAAHDLDTARSQLEHLCSSRQTLLDGAQWALDTDNDLPAHAQAVDAARLTLEARQADQRAARAGLDRVLEQRTAASVAMQDAGGQLDEIDGAGMDENGLRRELEAAGQAVRTAHDAHAAAVARVQALVGEHDAIQGRCALLQERLAGCHAGGLHADADFDRVQAGLDAWNDAVRTAGPDAYAQALADAFSDLQADLEELQQDTGSSPDPEALRRAQDAVDQAANALHHLEADVVAPSLTPADRAELDAAHAAVDAAAERTGRHLGKGSAQRKLEEARAVERALLDRFGFGSYLDVVLTGGRAATTSPERLAAERAYVAAKSARDGLQRAQRSSPEMDHLRSERARLVAHAVEHLGVDPGDDAISLLRSHPQIPASVVAGLRAALASVGIAPVGVSLPLAAHEWLQRQTAVAAEHRHERAEAEELAVELDDLLVRLDDVAGELAAARQLEAAAAEQLDLASRSVGAVEAELSARAGEDTSRLKRFVAAEQLRTQVEALTATLSRAEHDARALFDRASEAAAAAEVAFDRAQGAIADLARRARTLAEELPIDRRPSGDRLATLVALAGLLREHVDVLQPVIDEAEAAAAAASVKVDRAFAAAEAAGTGSDGPRPEDLSDGLKGLLEAHGDHLIVLDDPFGSIDHALRPTLLEVLLNHEGQGPLVLLTEDPEILGWAIGLPAEQGAVASADSVLNLSHRKADTKASNPTPKPPARLPAGRR